MLNLSVPSSDIYLHCISILETCWEESHMFKSRACTLDSFNQKMILLRLSFVFALVNSGLVDYGPTYRSMFGIGADIEPLSECP